MTSFDVNESVVLVEAPVEDVSRALCALRGASVQESDAYEKAVVAAEEC